MKITMTEYPGEYEWMEVKKRALVTAGKKVKTPPPLEWRRAILRARHSPIRRLHFSFFIEGIPSWVSVHLCRHVHAQPYVKSQRNDRQEEYDRNAARQDEPVNMIWDLTGEELMIVANKRLCMQASPETREVVKEICRLVEEGCPEYRGLLVPACVYHGGICYEMFPCERGAKNAQHVR